MKFLTSIAFILLFVGTQAQASQCLMSCSLQETQEAASEKTDSHDCHGGTKKTSQPVDSSEPCQSHLCSLKKRHLAFESLLIPADKDEPSLKNLTPSIIPTFYLAPRVQFKTVARSLRSISLSVPLYIFHQSFLH